MGRITATTNQHLMSGSDQPVIRNLSAKDLPDVTRVHLKAFPKSALTQLGAEVVRRYYQWQLCGPHDVVALGIFQGETLVGFCFGGVFRGALSGFLQKNKKYLFWRIITHPWLIANPLIRQRLDLSRSLLSPAQNKSVPPPQNHAPAFGILSIATDPGMQNKGCGRQLMLQAEKVASERGFTHMHLSVDQDNLQAICFYEHAGWCKCLDETGGWHGHMEKQLPGAII